MKYPLIQPDVAFEEVESDLREILESGRLTSGPFVEKFENQVAELVGAPYAVAVTSATTAMQLALAVSDIGAGDEVLVADFTYPATANAVHWSGARPVLVDCLTGRFDMDPDYAERHVTDATRAILVVDPFGQPAELGALRDLAKTYGLILIEDAACALGAQKNGTPCGGWPDFGCISFHPRKIVTTGEGGIVTCHDEDSYNRLKRLRTHGAQINGRQSQFVEPGFNFRMSEFQAALGLPQLGRLNEIVRQRREIAHWYIDATSDLTDVAVPLSSAPDDCTFQSFVVMLEEHVDRLAVIEALAQVGIETTLGTYACHSQPAFTQFGYAPGQLPNSHRNQESSLTLPMPHWLKVSDVEFIVESLAAAIKPYHSDSLTVV